MNKEVTTLVRSCEKHIHLESGTHPQIDINPNYMDFCTDEDWFCGAVTYISRTTKMDNRCH